MTAVMDLNEEWNQPSKHACMYDLLDQLIDHFIDHEMPLDQLVNFDNY